MSLRSSRCNKCNLPMPARAVRDDTFIRTRYTGRKPNVIYGNKTGLLYGLINPNQIMYVHPDDVTKDHKIIVNDTPTAKYITGDLVERLAKYYPYKPKSCNCKSIHSIMNIHGPRWVLKNSKLIAKRMTKGARDWVFVCGVIILVCLLDIAREGLNGTDLKIPT